MGVGFKLLTLYSVLVGSGKWGVGGQSPKPLIYFSNPVSVLPVCVGTLDGGFFQFKSDMSGDPIFYTGISIKFVFVYKEQLGFIGLGESGLKRDSGKRDLWPTGGQLQEKKTEMWILNWPFQLPGLCWVSLLCRLSRNETYGHRCAKMGSDPSWEYALLFFLSFFFQ